MSAAWSAGIPARLSSGGDGPSQSWSAGILARLSSRGDGPNPPAPFPTREGGAMSAWDRGCLACARTADEGAQPVWSVGVRTRHASDSGAPVSPDHRWHGATSVEAKAELAQC